MQVARLKDLLERGSKYGHRALHRAGNERRWWANAGITPLERAEELWAESLSARNPLDPSMPTPMP
jgi:hypothetical protein